MEIPDSWRKTAEQLLDVYEHAWSIKFVVTPDDVKNYLVKHPYLNGVDVGTIAISKAIEWMESVSPDKLETTVLPHALPGLYTIMVSQLHPVTMQKTMVSGFVLRRVGHPRAGYDDIDTEYVMTCCT